MDFCQTTYEAGAGLADWDRAALGSPDKITNHKAAQHS